MLRSYHNSATHLQKEYLYEYVQALRPFGAGPGWYSRKEEMMSFDPCAVAIAYVVMMLLILCGAYFYYRNLCNAMRFTLHVVMAVIAILVRLCVVFCVLIAVVCAVHEYNFLSDLQKCFV